MLLISDNAKILLSNIVKINFHLLIVVTCARPSVPDHSSIAPADAEIEYDNLITYTCNLGYNRTGGNETRRCAETGEWTGTEANCTCM